MTTSRPRALAGVVAALVAAAATLAFTLPGHPTAAAQPAVHQAARAELPPMPALHPTIVQPSVTAVAAAPATSAKPARVKDRVPTHAATRGRARTHPSGPLGGSVTNARALPNGVAVPPLEAPQAVRDIILSGDEIARTR